MTTGTASEFATLAARAGRIRRDRRSGALSLGIEALRISQDALEQAQRDPSPAARTWLAAIGRGLARAQPAMAPVVGAGEELVRAARLDRTRSDFTRRRRAIARRIRAWAAETGRLVRWGVVVFPPQATVVSISDSSNVRALLEALPRATRPREVRVFRSRPGGEGVRAVRALRRAGLTAHVVDDGDLVGSLHDADLVLLGADALEPDGSLVHKWGTRPLAEAAHGAHVPVVVVAGQSKRAPRRLRWADGGRYDRTPARLIREVWTDAGRLTPAELRRAPR